MRALFRIFLTIVLILVLAIIAELVPPFRQLTDYLDRNPQPYKSIAIAMSVSGWILMAGIIGYMVWINSKTSTDNETSGYKESFSATSARTSKSIQGRAFHREVTCRQIKEVWQSGGWNQAQWLPIFLGLLALIFITVGMFGFFFIIGPPLVKLVCAGALAYATVRTVWAFWIA